jgi:hypothetical protein
MPSLPELDSDTFAPTRDALHAHAKVLGAVRRTLTPKQRHWWHISLHMAATGLTTTPITLPDGSFDLTLNMVEIATVLRTSGGERQQLQLNERSPSEHYKILRQVLQPLGAALEADSDGVFADESLAIDGTTARTYLQVLARMDLALKQFAGRLRRGTGPVQLFPHHFDLAVSWFSGRLVPGEDPDDEGSADEQLTFGFAPGDESIQQPYVYATAYPQPEGWGEFELPSSGRWQTEGFHGAVLDYDALLESTEPEEKVLDFLLTVQRRGAELMKG